MWSNTRHNPRGGKTGGRPDFNNAARRFLETPRRIEFRSIAEACSVDRLTEFRFIRTLDYSAAGGFAPILTCANLPASNVTVNLLSPVVLSPV